MSHYDLFCSSFQIFCFNMSSYVLDLLPNLMLNFKDILLQHELVCFGSTIKQTSCLIKLATVVFSFPFPFCTTFQIFYFKSNIFLLCSQTNLMSHQVSNCCLLLPLLTKLWPVVGDPDQRESESAFRFKSYTLSDTIVNNCKLWPVVGNPEQRESEIWFKEIVQFWNPLHELSIY